jgi:hypothetical protein
MKSKRRSLKGRSLKRRRTLKGRSLKRRRAPPSDGIAADKWGRSLKGRSLKRRRSLKRMSPKEYMLIYGDDECHKVTMKWWEDEKTYYNGIYFKTEKEYSEFIKKIPETVNKDNKLVYFICFYIKHYINSMFFYQNFSQKEDGEGEFEKMPWKDMEKLKEQSLEEIHKVVDLNKVTNECEVLCQFLYKQSRKDRNKTDKTAEWTKKNKFIIQSLSTGNGFVEYLFCTWLLLNHNIQSLIVSNEPFEQRNYINGDPYIHMTTSKSKKDSILGIINKYSSICIGINIQGAKLIDLTYFLFDVPVIEIFFDSYLFKYENIEKFEESFTSYKSIKINKMHYYNEIKEKFVIINNNNKIFEDVNFDVILFGTNKFSELVRISFILKTKTIKFNIFVRPHPDPHKPDETNETLIIMEAALPQGIAINLTEKINEKEFKETALDTINRFIEQK